MKRNHHNHHNHPRNRDQSRNQSSNRNQHYANELLMAVLLTAFFVLLFGAIALMVPTQ